MRGAKRRHPVRRFISRLCLLKQLAAAGVGAFFGVNGYRMYQDAVSRTSIEERVEEIRAKEDFTDFSEMSDFYIEAVISVEDHRFMSHPGIDPIAVVRAAWADIQAMAFVEGGSTITQQLAKNLLFTQEKRMVRKAAEVFAVFDMEKKYSKEEIFELYVNTANFGSGYEGIHAASTGYFGKLPAEVTDYEAAMLAGVPNAPSVYSPDISQELAARRVELVLQSMVRHHVITREEAEEVRSGGSVSCIYGVGASGRKQSETVVSGCFFGKKVTVSSKEKQINQNMVS